MSEFDELFRSELNSQGFGFQHAVVQSIHAHRENTWEAAATEFPVSYRDRSTHIDVLAWCYNRTGLLVGECKRVNPAFGQWVFARSPFTFVDRFPQQTWLERIFPAGRSNPVARLVPIPINAHPFQIAVEVKTRSEGDPAGLPKGRALSLALTQVAVGVNGLIHMLPQQRGLLEARGPIVLIPTIFTTARLFATDAADLHLSDLETGHMPVSAFEEQPWLWFESNISPDLLAEIQNTDVQKARQFKDLLPARHTRAIAIVGPSGMSKFLRAVPNLLHQIEYS